MRYEELLKQNEALKTDTRRRMESYIRREARYKEEIVSLRDELRRALAGLGGGDDEGVMGPLHAMHGQILTGLTGLQDKTKAVLQEQEADLLRAFRARLYDVQMELEAERSKKDDGALEWIERTRTLGKELDWSREEALRLDRTNQHLAKENGRLRNQAAAQDDDRQFLLRQLVALKKENAALRDTNLQIKAAAAAAANGALRPTATTAETTVEPLTRPGTSASTGALPWRQSASQASRLLPGSGGLAPSASVPHLARPTTTPAQRSRLSVAEPQLSAATAGGGTAVATAAVGKVAQLENRLREATANRAEAERRGATVASRLNKMIDAERRALRALRATHTRELQSRSELEIFLRQCIADVKAQLVRARHAPRAVPRAARRTPRCTETARLVHTRVHAMARRDRGGGALFGGGERACATLRRGALTRACTAPRPCAVPRRFAPSLSRAPGRT